MIPLFYRCYSLQLLAILFCVHHLPAQSPLWQIQKDHYQLDTGALRQILTEHRMAPKSKALELSLPTPDGHLRHFRCHPSRVLPARLARQYPRLHAFKGTSREDPHLQVRLEYSPRGLYAYVFQPGGDWLVEPLAGNGNVYRTLYRSGITASRWPVCGEQRRVVATPREELPPVGEQIRIYRLAVTATGEYTQFHGGTPEDALAAILTTVNRVNGLFERDLAIRLQLVEDNDFLIFTDPSDDPFTAGNESSQNQRFLDDNLGADEYDIGHAFGVSGTVSVGRVGSACRDDIKGQGYSRADEPVGAAFDIDIVAHELGHQLGANHTFNHCSGQAGLLPVEPGAGSTVMAFAGVPACAEADFFTRRSDAYFHSLSIEEIARYTYQEEGSTCPQLATFSTPPPEVDAGPDSLTLPISTPFELSGRGRGVIDSLLFNWEQIDGDQPLPLGSAMGQSPLFRSVAPRPDSTRVFPALADLIAGVRRPEAMLPDYARRLNFRFTVRNGRGGVNWVERSFAVTDQAGPFRVTQPSGSVQWQEGDSVTVAWAVANTHLAPVGAKTVDIYLSDASGRSFPHLLAADIPNEGAARVGLPEDVFGEGFRIKVKGRDHLFFQINDAPITIEPVTGVDNPSGAPIQRFAWRPNPFRNQLQLHFSLRTAAALQFELYATDGRLLHRRDLGRQLPGRNQVTLPLPDLPAGLYVLRLMDETGRGEWARGVKW